MRIESYSNLTWMVAPDRPISCVYFVTEPSGACILCELVIFGREHKSSRMDLKTTSTQS